MGKTFANYSCSKRLTSRKYKELGQLSSNETNNLLLKNK
jgi:hypothetical protein